MKLYPFELTLTINPRLILAKSPYDAAKMDLVSMCHTCAFQSIMLVVDVVAAVSSAVFVI